MSSLLAGDPFGRARGDRAAPRSPGRRTTPRRLGWTARTCRSSRCCWTERRCPPSPTRCGRRPTRSRGGRSASSAACGPAPPAGPTSGVGVRRRSRARAALPLSRNVTVPRRRDGGPRRCGRAARGRSRRTTRTPARSSSRVIASRSTPASPASRSVSSAAAASAVSCGADRPMVGESPERGLGHRVDHAGRDQLLDVEHVRVGRDPWCPYWPRAAAGGARRRARARASARSEKRAR